MLNEGWQNRIEYIGQSRFEIRDRADPDRPDRRNTQIEIRIESPWVRTTLSFRSCGDCDMREWIATIGADYIADKAFGIHRTRPDLPATLKDLRGRIGQARSEQHITTDQADRFRAIVRRCEDDRLSGQDDDSLLAGLIGSARLAEDLGGMGFSDYRPATRQPANVKAFVRHAWGRLQDRFQAELDRERLSRPVPEEAFADTDPEGTNDMDMSL